MAGKLPKKAEHNKGRSHFKTYDEWYKASRKEKKVNGVSHYTYDSTRMSKAEWTNHDNRLARRIANNPRSARAADLELVFGSPRPSKRDAKRPSKRRGKWMGDAEPMRYAA